MKNELEYGCIGEKLGHSFSKEIHACLGNYDYRLCELSAEDLPGFIKARAFRGVNVTVPYKQMVLPFLDDIDTVAEETGAVNTVINRDGKLTGYNTDFDGLTALIKRTDISLSGKKVLIAGSGGTSKTAQAVAKHLGASHIVRVSRTGKDGCADYEKAKKACADFEVLINTTPCGMFPDTDGAPLDLDDYPCLQGVVDVVYNPLRTSLILQAQDKNIPAVGGLYMLVAQAVRASELFQGCRYGDGITEKIYKKILFEKQNIVLIGMPSSGKTSVGKHLAQLLSLPFFDTDEEIEKEKNMSISDIFSTYGETFFRKEECLIIKKICKNTGAVIATGGGSVLDEKNIRALRRNGMLIFLDRPFEQLQSTQDRPTAPTKEALARLYKSRLPVYEKCADIKVKTENSVEITAEKIAEIWGETV